MIAAPPRLARKEGYKDQVSQDLEKAVVAHKFGVMTVHDLNETIRKKGVQFDRPLFF